MRYQVCVSETLERVVEVEAESESGAIGMVLKRYGDGEMILLPEDHNSTEVFILK